ncbi:MAG: hypothetical protein GY943_24980 [Chloroflexi bacterium]|nr:hypothetical protein [Chloroflexota bacterium]
METNPADEEWMNIQETIIPADVPAGVYLLNITTGNVNDQLIVILTDNSIIAKISDEQLIAWVTDINDHAQPNVPVSILTQDGTIIASGSTNEDGVFRANVPTAVNNATQDEAAYLVIAEQNGTLAVTGLQRAWRTGGLYSWGRTNKSSVDYAAYIYTDRPIYKPGQTVYFKGIVRQDDDAVLSMIPTGTAVTIRIRDARNNLVQTIPLISNSFGTVDGEFEIATGAMLGTYQVELIVDNQIHTQPFRVEDYRKPDYEVTVSTDHEFYVKGDLINITIDTEYFFGEPVPNAEVEIRQFQLIENFQWSGMPGEYIWLNDYGSPITGTTDENGRFTTAIRANYHGNYNNYWYGRNLNHTIWGIEATVSDDSNQTVSSFNPIRVYNASQQISVEHANFHEPGQPFPLHATVTNLDGQPVANKTVTIHLLRYRNGNYDDEVQSGSFTTDANGNAHTNFVANEPGYYRLELRGTDGNNHPIQYKSWLYAFSSNRSSGWNGRNTGLHIDADKTSYAPGETAVLYIESQIAGPALLTIERGTIRREELVMLTPPLTQVELPIETTDAPNVFATITTWKPQNLTIDDDIYFSLNDSTIHSASIELSVPASDKQLQVTITPDQESYAPGDEATFTVKVTNNAGVPVSAEVSLALVDDAIFALSDELSGPIYEGFYFDRDNLIRTFHSMAPQRYLGGGMGGGGGGGDAAGNPRRDFQDTAVWIPTLHTDFNGEVQVTVTLPDNLTRWRMTAKATTADTQVGETITTVTATQPVLIRPLLPRTLTAGDNFQLTGLLHNNTNQPQKLAVTLQETGDTQKLTIADPITLTLMLEPGEVRAVGWTVIVTEAGSAEIIMIAQYNDDSTTLSPTGVADSVLLPLSIRPLAIPNVETEVGQFTNQYETSITIPNDALEMSEVQIQLSRSIAGSMLDGLGYLTGYPYGCVEQTMSKALPNAVVGRAMNQLGISIPELEADLPRQINASIQRLYGFQHDDGGWGWWFDDKTHDYQTAWVLYGLVTTKEAGYEVDAQVIERGANWLIENLNQMDEKTRAFALYSLAIAGYGDETETVTLAENADELDTFAQASLALALFAMDRSDAARELLDLLAETAVIFENGYVYWEGNANDGNYSRKTMASDTRNTAIALSAFARIQPNHPLEPGIVRWLMAMRQQSGWGTTNETAFAIVGLTDHLISTRFSDTTANTTYSVLINGETFTTGSLNGNNPATTVSIPRAALEGQNEVVITQDGERPLYFVVNTRTYLAEPTIQKAGVVNVIRTYRDPGTNAPIESIAAGELVRVQLMINMPEAGSYILIEDNLPGGLEALNEGLNITSHAVEQYADVKYSWQRYGYNQKEVHGDHVSFFVTELPKGSHTFTYYARATQTGTFTAMPTEVSAMYDFAFWGRSGSTQLIINK